MTGDAVEGRRDEEVTALLQAWQRGDDEALRNLAPMVYEELRRIASNQMRGERSDHTLQPTALVNEVFLRLHEQRDRRWKERRQFFAVAARLMRHVLVDHARGRRAAKRGGDATRVDPKFLSRVAAPSPGLDVLVFDEALERLAAYKPRLAQVVELRFFGGLEVEESAELLGCSPRTVKRDWVFARSWLIRELGI